MDCKRVVFSGHAIQRMFERQIRHDDVVAVIAAGETIADYTDDKPYPSRLLLGFIGNRPLHVVLASDELGSVCIAVTVYEPAREQWSGDFRTRTTK
jgi:hypothetical protein